MLIPPAAEGLQVLKIFRQLRIFWKTAPPGRPAFELGVGVHIKDIEQGRIVAHTGDALLVSAAPAGSEIAGEDLQGRIAFTNALRGGLEESAVGVVVPVSRFVADFHRIDQLAFSGRAKLARE